MFRTHAEMVAEASATGTIRIEGKSESKAMVTAAVKSVKKVETRGLVLGH